MIVRETDISDREIVAGNGDVFLLKTTSVAAYYDDRSTTALDYNRGLRVSLPNCAFGKGHFNVHSVSGTRAQFLLQGATSWFLLDANRNKISSPLADASNILFSRAGEIWMVDKNQNARGCIEHVRTGKKQLAPMNYDSPSPLVFSTDLFSPSLTAGATSGYPNEVEVLAFRRQSVLTIKSYTVSEILGISPRAISPGFQFDSAIMLDDIAFAVCYNSQLIVMGDKNIRRICLSSDSHLGPVYTEMFRSPDGKWLAVSFGSNDCNKLILVNWQQETPPIEVDLTAAFSKAHYAVTWRADGLSLLAFSPYKIVEVFFGDGSASNTQLAIEANAGDATSREVFLDIYKEKVAC